MNSRNPDTATRLVAHALVGFTAMLVVAKAAKGKVPAIVTFLVTAAMHEMADAPVARWLAEME